MLHYISQGIVGWQIKNGYLEQKERSKLTTTSSTGGLLLALQRAIITARP